MAFLDFPNQEIEIPAKAPLFKVLEVLIHCTSTRLAKIWEVQKWTEVIKYCKSNGISTGIIGAIPSAINQQYRGHILEEELLKAFKHSQNDDSWELKDLRGKTSLIELAGACKQASALITSDSGPMHIALAVKTRTLAL